MFNIDLNSDWIKALIVAIIFLILALNNFYNLSPEVLAKMKARLNMKRDKIYHEQNLHCNNSDTGNSDGNSDITGNVSDKIITKATQNANQTGGFAGFYYIDRAPENRMSKWDEVPNQWDPVRLHDKYNEQSNPIVYQGFGIPLMTDLMCSSFAGVGKETKNGNDRAVVPEYDRNDLGTLPSDKKSMFYFSDNISAPECCPGPYSSDAGCVCSFEKASF